ncbi:hypothetical protein EMIT047CA2_60026 [Pseudomonas soli]
MPGCRSTGCSRGWRKDGWCGSTCSISGSGRCRCTWGIPRNTGTVPRCACWRRYCGSGVGSIGRLLLDGSLGLVSRDVGAFICDVDAYSPFRPYGGLLNEMVTPAPCEAYAFAGCFFFGDRHHEQRDTDRHRHRQTYLPPACPRQVRQRGVAQEVLKAADDAVSG